jgi:hypothetical protein
VGSLFILAALLGSLGLVDTAKLKSSQLGDRALPFWSVCTYLVGVLLVAIGIGLRSRSPWARPLMVCFWGILALLNIAWFVFALDHGKVATADFTSILILPVAAWYIYGKRSVRTYFDSLKVRQA